MGTCVCYGLTLQTPPAWDEHKLLALETPQWDCELLLEFCELCKQPQGKWERQAPAMVVVVTDPESGVHFSSLKQINLHRLILCKQSDTEAVSG